MSTDDGFPDRGLDDGSLDDDDSPPTTPADPAPPTGRPDPPGEPNQAAAGPPWASAEELTAVQDDIRSHHAQLYDLRRSTSQLARVFDQIEKTLTAPPPTPTPGPPGALPAAIPPDGTPVVPAAAQGTSGEGPEAPAQEDVPAAGVTPGLDPPTLIAWVRDNVAWLLERIIPGSSDPYWCDQWWRHPEALARMDTVRHVWLDGTREPSGAAKFAFWQCLDHQITALMAPNGPFARCGDSTHSAGDITTRRLAHTDPDEDFYATFDRAQPTTGDTTPHPAGASHPPAPPSPTAPGGPGHRHIAPRRAPQDHRPRQGR